MRFVGGPPEVAPPMIHPFCEWAMPGFLAGSSTPASATWPTANLAVFFPFHTPISIPVKRYFVANGATAASAWAVSLYYPDGTRIDGSGAVTQAGAAAVQFQNATAGLTIAPGQYYLGMSSALTTLTVVRHTMTGVEQARQMGMYQMATAHPQSGNATFAVATNNLVPYFGLSTVASP